MSGGDFERAPLHRFREPGRAVHRGFGRRLQQEIAELTPSTVRIRRTLSEHVALTRRNDSVARYVVGM